MSERVYVLTLVEETGERTTVMGAYHRNVRAPWPHSNQTLASVVKRNIRHGE